MQDMKLLDLLAQLPPNYRRVLELRLHNGRSIRETARTMHVSEAAAKVLQYQAVKRVATLLRENEEALTSLVQADTSRPGALGPGRAGSHPHAGAGHDLTLSGRLSRQA